MATTTQSTKATAAKKAATAKKAPAKKAASSKTTTAKKAPAKGAAKTAPPQSEAPTGEPALVEAAVQARKAQRLAVGERDAAIRAAVEGGANTLQVAMALKMPHKKVQKIVK